MRIKHNQLHSSGLDLDEIANINRQVLAHKVDKSFLNAHQKTLVWEIRRKNKNRLAAAKCRKRKLEDITINSESKDELTADFIVSIACVLDSRIWTRLESSAILRRKGQG